MNTLIHLAETWWPLYAVHMVEISFFIVLVWSLDRWLALDSRLRYALYLLALAKVFVPPVLAIPIPAFLVSPAGVAVDATAYFGSVSEAVAVFPEPAATLPPAFYLFCLWILSVLVWTGAALWKNAAFRRALKPASPVDLASEIASLNAPETLKVYSKPTLPSPILVGLRRPRLFLPSKWSSWSSEELRGVLKHELAHHERRDIYVLILQALATALFGANPLIWLLNRRLAYLRELRCDEAVLRETNLTPADYGRLLLGFVDTRSSPGPLTVFFTERGATLKKRLEHILNYKAGNMNRSKRQTVALILVGLMIVPLSIREAYTQNDVSKSATNVEMAVPEKVQRTAPPVTGNSDTVTVGVPTDDEAEVEKKPVTGSQLKSTVVVRDAFLQYVNSRTAPDTGFVATVTLNVRADVHGSVEDVKLVNVEGPAGFENAVRDAVSRMKFEPAKHDSVNAPVWFTQQMSFHWHGTSKRSNPANLLAAPDTGLVDVIEIDQVETKPHPIHIVGPEFPEEAFKIKTEGMVTLRLIVNVDSSVSDVTVLSGPEIFHRAAVDAVLQWRFRPAKIGGRAVPVSLVMPIGFSHNAENEHEILPAKRTGQAPTENPDRVTAPKPGQGDNGDQKTLEFWSVDEKPVVSHAVEPIYPDAARKARLTGNVFLKFKVNVDGSVSDVNVIKGNVVFKKPAIDAASQYRFIPAKHDGKPVAVWMTHRIKFNLPKQEAGRPEDQTDVQAETTFEIWDVDIKPVVTHSAQPIYPELARLTGGRTGSVHVKFIVNENGSVSDVRPLKGQSIFIKPAIDAISQYRFKPAEYENEPVAVWMTHRINFQPPEPKATIDGENVFDLRTVDKTPVVVHAVQPIYPDVSKEAGLVGQVALKFKVGVDGTVSNVDAFVLKGGEDFRKPAIEAITRFLYKPAEHEGKPVAVWITHHFTFTPPEPGDGTDHRTGDIGRDKVFEISEVDIAPVPPSLLEVRPNYPEVAQKAGLTGRVVLKFKVNEDGSVSDVHILKGDEIFREPAIESVTRLRYKPAIRAGKAVPVWLTMSVTFALPKNRDETVSDTIDPGVGD